MFVAIEENLESLRIRVSGDVKRELDALVERKQTTQQAVVNSVLRWLFEQDDLVQSMVLGQVRPSEDLAELIIRRLAEKARGPRPLRESRVGVLRKERPSDR